MTECLFTATILDRAIFREGQKLVASGANSMFLKRGIDKDNTTIIDGAGSKEDFGFNAEMEKYENLMESGVIDPTKVVRFALQNAASVAGLMITTEALISEKPKKRSTGPSMSEMGEDMY